MSQRKLVIDGAPMIRREPKVGKVSKGRAVAGGDRPALGICGVEVRQERREDGRLDLVEPRIEAERPANALALRKAVISQRPHPLGQPGIVRHDGTAVADAAEILGGVERIGGGMAEGAERAAIKGGTVGLGAILDHRQPVPDGKRHEGRHIGRVPEQVDRHDRSGARVHSVGSGGGVDAAGTGIDVNEAGLRAALKHGLRAAGEGEGRQNDLVAESDPERTQCQRQRIRPGGDADAVLAPAIGREVRLEAGHGRAQDVAVSAKHGGDGRIDLAPEPSDTPLRRSLRDHAARSAKIRLGCAQG